VLNNFLLPALSISFTQSDVYALNVCTGLAVKTLRVSVFADFYINASR
jgi:hypothetical protein